MEEDYGASGYLYEPDRSAYQGHLSSTSSSSESDSEGENLSLLALEGRSNRPPSTWCKCGECTSQKTDVECYCCKEHELLADRIGDLQCITQTENLDQYIVHKPSLEMAFINAMLQKFVKGPAPEGELTNK